MIKLVSCMRMASTVRPIPIILIVFPSHSFMKSLSIPGKRQTALVAIKALTLSMPGKARKKRIPVPTVCNVSNRRTRPNSRIDGVSYVWKRDWMWDPHCGLRLVLCTFIKMTRMQWNRLNNSGAAKAKKMHHSHATWRMRLNLVIGTTLALSVG